MQSLRCIIVDDEPIARNILLEYVQRDDRLTLAASHSTATDALREFNTLRPDIIFLDIKMPNISGFEMLRSLPQQPYIIFTTAYREYAVEGFNLNAVDYLLKPFSFERFLQSVNKVFLLNVAKTAGSHAAHTEENGKDIFVKSDGKLFRLNLDDIYYIEALKEYVRIFSKDGSHVIYQTMQHLEEKLPPEMFFRIHRSYIVGLRHIKTIEGNTVTVHQTQLPISRYTKDQFMKNIAGNKLL